MLDLHELPNLLDSWTYLYLELFRIDQERRPLPYGILRGALLRAEAPAEGGVSRATMTLPGETEAGSAGMQPGRGIAWRAHRDDVERGSLYFRALPQNASDR
jgi:hypothetical protein